MRRLPHQLDAYDGKEREEGKALHGVGRGDRSERLTLSQASLPTSRENLRELSGGGSPGRSSADKVDLASSRGLNRWVRHDRGGFVDDLDPFESSSALTAVETWASETGPGALRDWLWRPEEEGGRDTSEGEWTWEGALRGVWGVLSGSLGVSLEVEWHADDGEANAAEVEALIGEEQRGRVQSYRRRLQTSSSSVVKYEAKVVSWDGGVDENSVHKGKFKYIENCRITLGHTSGVLQEYFRSTSGILENTQSAHGFVSVGHCWYPVGVVYTIYQCCRRWPYQYYGKPYICPSRTLSPTASTQKEVRTAVPLCVASVLRVS